MKQLYTTLFAFFLVCLAGCGKRETNSNLAKQLESIEERLDAMIGDLKSAREQILDFENEIKIKKPKEMGDVVSRLENFRNSLPMLTAIELSEELSNLDWLVSMRLSEDDEPTPLSLLSEAEALEQVPATLKDYAQKRKAKHAKKCMKFARDLAKRKTVVAQDTEIILELLSGFEDGEEGFDDLGDIESELNEKTKILTKNEAQKALDNRVESLKKQFEKIEKISDLDLKEMAFAGISQQVDSMQIGFAMDGNYEPQLELNDLKSKVDEELAKAIARKSKRQKERYDNAAMKYQDWALNQIRSLNEEIDNEKINNVLYHLRDKASEVEGRVHVRIAKFDGVRSLFEQALGDLTEFYALETRRQKEKVGEFVDENWYRIVYQVKHDAAVEYLLPINQSLLEPPVAKFYTQAFDKVWEEIGDSKNLQLSLARKTAEVPKETIGRFAEEIK